MPRPAPSALLFALLLAPACGGRSQPAPDADATPDAATPATAAAVAPPVNPDHFVEGIVDRPLAEVACTLGDGSETVCYAIQAAGVPTNHEVGPWCPTHVDQGPEAGGIWPEGGHFHDVSGAFIRNLAVFYDDEIWKMYNADGSINVTDSKAKCEAAARPDVDPAMQNHCVQCLPSYLDQADRQVTQIPKQPRKAAAPTPVRGNIGVALNGTEFANSAPTHAILAAHTLAPFDDCGGHINVHEGYHYHAVTSGCLREIAQPDGHAGLIGYAMDGFGMYAMTSADGAEPTDLDDCRGHSDDTRGYHYHVSGAGENKILSCFAGEVPGGGGQDGPPGGPPPDGARGGPPPDGAQGGPPAGGAAVAPCSDGQTDHCCGDGTCDGPETADNCAQDCP